MKKRIVSAFVALSAFALVGGALAGQQFNEARAEDASSSEVAAVLANYHTDHAYTKKTEIFLSDDAVTDLDTITNAFHAHEKRLKRTTYYDETANALLMGDYDGGFASINSGYALVDGNMDHYRYGGTNESSADYFTNRNKDYTVKDTNPNEYFVNLTSLAATVTTSSGWTKGSSSDYYYNFTDLGIDEKGDYNDPILKNFQYFVAPMLLQKDYSSYFTFSWLRIQTTTDWLTIRLYVGQPGTKVTLKDGDYGVLAEARVWKGIQSWEAKPYLKGTFDSWGDGVAMNYAPDYYTLDQYKAAQSVGYDGKIGISWKDGWYGYTAVENQKYFAQDGNDVLFKTSDQTYDFYFKSGSGTIYIGFQQNFNIDVSVTIWSGFGTADLYIYGYNYGGSANTGDWPGQKITPVNDLYSATLPGWVYKWIVVRVDPEASDPSKGVWNQTESDILLSDADYHNIHLNGYVSEKMSYIPQLTA